MRILLLIVAGLSFTSNLFSQEDSTITIEAVSVEAYHVSRQLRGIPGSLSVLTAGNLQVSDGTSLQALNTLPGVTLQSGTYTTNRIIIRGMGSRTPYNTNRIRTYLNDIPLTTSDGLSSPEEIDITGLGRLEIIKGPSSALYGSGLGGNINLYTPSINMKRIKAGLQYGSFNTIKPSVSASFSRRRNSLWSSLSHLHSDGYRQNSRYDRTSLLLTATHLQDKWKMDFLFLLIGVNSGIPSSLGVSLFEQDPQAAAPNWKAVNGYKKYTRGVAGITLTGRLTDRITNKFSVFGRGINSYERRPFNNLDDHSLSAGIRNKLNIHTAKTDVVIGMEWIAEQYSWKLDTSTLINNNREKRSQLNVFGMVYYQPLPGLNLSVAGAVNYIRYRLDDHFPDNGNQSGKRTFPLIFSPRVGINYSPDKRWAIYASAGHGFSLPSPEETLLPAGDVNPSIKHEDGWQAEIGTRLNLSERVSIDATLYWIELKNLLVTKRITEDIFTGANAGKTRHQGFEFIAYSKLVEQKDFPGNLLLNFSYTLTSNHFRQFSDDGNSFDGNQLPGIPSQAVFMQLSWSPLKFLSISPDIRYTGKQYLNDANTVEYEDYLVGNLKINTDLLFWDNTLLSIYAGINNVGNTAYASMLIVNATGFGGSEPRYFYPGLPKNYYVGVTFTF